MRWTFLWITFLGSYQAYAGTVAGRITSASNTGLGNGTLTFTLTQAAVAPSSAITPVPGSVAGSGVNCWTDSQGNVVGLPGNAAVALPSLTTGSGSLPAGTYFVRYTWVGMEGETEASQARAVTVGGGGAVTLQPPLNVPANATGMNVYMGVSSGGETLQTTTTPIAVVNGALTGGYTQSGVLTTNSNAIPATNSTKCKLRFNDELVPSYTGYNVDMVNVNGLRVAGFPQKWYLAGGAGGTVNVGTGTPLYAGVVQYPQAIVTNPPSGMVQSINGPLNLNGFGLTAGSINSSSSILAPDGAAGAPGLAFALEPGTGMGRSAAGQEFLSIQGSRKIVWDNTQRMSSTFPLTWSSAVEPFGNPPDVSLSRLQTGVVAVGAGASGAVDGFLNGQGIALNRIANTGVSLSYDTPGKYQFGSAAVAGWTSGLSSATLDTGLSRTVAGTVAIGNGTQGDSSGTLRVGTILGTALGGTGSTNPDTKYNRLKANQGSAITCADVSGITNFGSLASCASASGSDSAGSITITSAGTGQIANGFFTLNFHDGTWTNPPTCVANRAEGLFPGNTVITTSPSATAVTFFFIGLPAAGTNYIHNFICIGR